jgi:hypothetical protein
MTFHLLFTSAFRNPQFAISIFKKLSSLDYEIHSELEPFLQTWFHSCLEKITNSRNLTSCVFFIHALLAISPTLPSFPLLQTLDPLLVIPDDPPIFDSAFQSYIATILKLYSKLPPSFDFITSSSLENMFKVLNFGYLLLFNFQNLVDNVMSLLLKYVPNLTYKLFFRLNSLLQILPAESQPLIHTFFQQFFPSFIQTPLNYISLSGGFITPFISEFVRCSLLFACDLIPFPLDFLDHFFHIILHSSFISLEDYTTESVNGLSLFSESFQA